MPYPLLLKAPLHDLPWGGTKLKTLYHKQTELPRVAESLELYCNDAVGSSGDECSLIRNGTDAGMTLLSYIALKGERILGLRALRVPYFPLSVKLIDTAIDSPVRVHPADRCAQRGRTEVWYVLEAEPNARVMYGFNRELSRDELRQRILTRNIGDVCNWVPATPGDVFFIEPGTAHAIGAGVTLLSVAQNSPAAYELYDYARPDVRMDKSLDVVSLAPVPHTKLLTPTMLFAEYDMLLLATCKYFTVYHFGLHGRCHLNADKTSFHVVNVLDGDLKLECRSSDEEMRRGDTAFVPACYGDYWLRGTGQFMLTMV